MPKTPNVVETLDVRDNVRAELARHRVTQGNIAKHLGLTRSSMSRRMRGETAFKDRELKRIAGYLGISVSELFNNNDGSQVSA